MVDKDDQHFKEEDIRRWKEQAEDRQFKEIDEGYQGADIELEEVDIEARQLLGLPDTDNITALLPRLDKAAERGIEVYKRHPNWPSAPIKLDLTDSKSQQPATELMLAAAMERGGILAIIAPPGTGKSTTMGQLAEAVLERNKVAPVILKLTEWSLQQGNLLRFICSKPSWAAFNDRHLMLAATHGKLALILDGWNEIDPDDRLRLIVELQELNTEFPLLSIAVSTRRQATDLPLNPRIIEVDPLTEEQQVEIAKALRGADGETLLDRAWRTPGIHDLIRIPLYLTALLTSTPGKELPKTKEAILRLFVKKHEQDAEKIEIYNSELLGNQTIYLSAIAASTTATANVSLLEVSTREVIKSTADELIKNGQLSICPEPATVIDTLVNRHTLVRTGEAEATIKFQHQQIQEWYASFDVERLISQAANGDAAAKQMLRQDILNLPAWEEAVLFACERLSEDHAHQEALAEATVMALGIDPMLAAEMIYRSGNDVWKLTSPHVLAFVNRWHLPKTADRAIRFMLLSGREEFQELIWTVLTDPDKNKVFGAIRSATRVRPDALGNIKAHLAGLPEERRELIAGELIHNGNGATIEAIATYARDEKAPEVLKDIIKSLLFRRANKLAEGILTNAPVEVWKDLARNGYAEEFKGTPAEAGLRKELETLSQETDSPYRRLVNLVHTGQELSPEEIQQAIAEADFKANRDNASTLLSQVHAKAPVATAQGLAKRLEEGRDIPFGCEELLAEAPLKDDEVFIQQLLGGAKFDKAISKICGPNAVEAMLHEAYERYQKLKDTRSDAASNSYHQIKDFLEATRPDVFVQALLRAQGTDNLAKIALFADILSQHSVTHTSEPLPQIRTPELVALLQAWTVKFLAEDATRYQMSELASAIGRVGDPDLLPSLLSLLDRELTMLAADKEAIRQAISQGGGRHGLTLHENAYMTALERTGGAGLVEAMSCKLTHPDFARPAAVVVKRLWLREQPRDDNPPFRSNWPDYSKVEAKRSAKASGKVPAHPFSKLILNAANELADRESIEDRKRAISIAQIGFTIPYENQDPLIAKLIELPVPITNKLSLLQSLTDAGEILSADLIQEGISGLYELAKKETWRLDHDHSELAEWFELLAFSTDPTKLLEAFKQAPARSLSNWRGDNLIRSLAFVPEHGETILFALARQHPEISASSEWHGAALTLALKSDVLDVLEKVVAVLDTRHQRHFETRQWALNIAEQARVDPEIKAYLVQRFNGATGLTHSVLYQALSELADEDAVIALINRHVEAQRPFDGNLQRAIRTAVTQQRPSAEWKGAFEVLPHPAPKLRKHLFGLMAREEPICQFAKRCLTYIDEIRDDQGRPDSEPRHPEIELGAPWPQEAG
ncbi:ATP-binding protein [Hyphomicrobium sp. LHD-15]|uniref:NACHT domain-containing protein n=1 Tax=Hyphomicrobium sp. LHD-15 TaxID=3072142 RepID=UPI0028109B01|nr:ATP-binding protein [Hyphomicrobium sp. LHD-15]MDQ8698136.1 ATP-binding protein [Hyphomicrobium sp. LHD-15]